MVSVGQELGSSLAGWFWFRVSYKQKSRCWLGLKSSEGLVGARRPTSNLTHVDICRRTQFFVPWTFHGATYDMVACFACNK